MITISLEMIDIISKLTFNIIIIMFPIILLYKFYTCMSNQCQGVYTNYSDTIGKAILISKTSQKQIEYLLNKKITRKTMADFNNKIYKKNYKIDLKNQQIFDLENKKYRNLTDFKANNEIKIPTFKEIEKRILHNHYFHEAYKNNKKNILINLDDNDIYCLINDDFFNKFFQLNEIYFDEKDYSIRYVYLSNINDNEEMFYKLETYSDNLFYKEIEKIKNNYQTVKLFNIISI